jgi:hypothetical protein
MKNSTRIVARLTGTIGFALALPLAHAQQGAWPRLEGEKQAECAQALQLAEHAFKSRQALLYEPQALPGDFPAMPVLQPDGLDISGGDALIADPASFDKVAANVEGARNLYWQKRAAKGYRLVVKEATYGWRGDQYTLFAIDPKISVDAFLAQTALSEPPPAAHASIEAGWRPPQLYRRGTDKQLWALTVGQPWAFLDGWQVWVPGADSLRNACMVRFHPEVKRAVDLLPEPLRQFEALLDRTMGSGEGEGTLNQTAQLRINVEHAWANAAMRPWASAAPYNSRATVDAALASWAAQGPANRRQFAAIRLQYPLAQQALSSYYRSQFGISADAAQRQAEFLLDVLFRSHYVFPRDEPAESGAQANGNPWPQS